MQMYGYLKIGSNNFHTFLLQGNLLESERNVMVSIPSKNPVRKTSSEVTGHFLTSHIRSSLDPSLHQETRDIHSQKTWV